MESLLLVRSLEEDEASSSSNTTELDPLVFWPVNGFILLLLVTACFMCYKFGGVDWWVGERRRVDSDAAFAERVRARQEAERERKRGTPEKRRKMLLKSFKRCKVHMIVQEGDLVDSKGDSENETTFSHDDGTAAVVETAVPLGEEEERVDTHNIESNNSTLISEQEPAVSEQEETLMNNMEEGNVTAETVEESEGEKVNFMTTDRSETPAPTPALEQQNTPPSDEGTPFSESSQQHLQEHSALCDEQTPPPAANVEQPQNETPANEHTVDVPLTNLPPTALEMMEVDDEVDDDEDDDSSHILDADEESLSKSSNNSAPAYAGGVLDDSDSGEHGYLILRETPEDEFSIRRRVPNCCAICLMCYEVGEHVVWSSNEKCPHAFHMDCLVDWLTKMRDGTPCPCCRAEFTDLEKHRKERRITWRADNAFNPNVVSLR